MFRYLVLLLAAVALAVAVWFGLGARYAYHLTASRQIRVDRFTGNIESWSYRDGRWSLHKYEEPKQPAFDFEGTGKP